MRFPPVGRNPRREGNLTATGFLLTLGLQPPIGARNVREGRVLKAKVRVLTAMHSRFGPQPAEADEAKSNRRHNPMILQGLIGTPTYAPARLGPSLASSSDRPRGQRSVVPA